MSLSRAKTDLAAVEAEIAEIKRRLEAERGLLQEAENRAQKLRATVEILTGYEVGTEPSLSMDVSSPYYGKSLGAAAALVLAKEAEPLTAASIVKLLRDAGWVFASANPPLAVYWALRSHAQKTGEIVTVPGSKWALTSSRPNAEHVAKSLAGLAAARERGVVLGPPRRVTDEMLVTMRKMFSEGATISKVAAALGVSEITIKRYRAREKMESADLGPNVLRLTR